MKRLPLLRILAIAMSLAFALSFMPKVMSAQSDEPPLDLPKSVQDGASISYSDENETFSVLEFVVFHFKDDDAAKEGQQELLDAIMKSFEASMASDGETPEAMPSLDEVKDVSELDGVGDEAHLYHLVMSDTAGMGMTFTAILVLVRDGANVHWYFTLGTDGSGAPSDALPSDMTFPTVDAQQKLLLGITHDWFDSDFDRHGALIDQLPSGKYIPAGYTEDSRATNLDELEGTPDAVSSRPAMV